MDLFQQLSETLGRNTIRRLETHPNQLAVDPNSVIVGKVADVLQQARNFWK